MKHIYTILLLFISFGLNAQDWKTVSDKDTVYFRAGKHGTGYAFGNSSDSGLLRAVWVASSQRLGNDSLFNFYKVVRSSGNFNECIDTAAPLWLGRGFLHKTTGMEYYFNSHNDTIIVKTRAQVGDTWTLARDSAGNEYRAIVTSSGITNIDNVTDSFKIITIQVYQNNTPVANWYSGFELQLSKDHGWITTIDMYRFPDHLSNWEGYGAVIDSGLHTRLPMSFTNLDIGSIDLAWKYKPGNEWIEQTLSRAYPQSYELNQKVIHDSVVTSTIIANSAIVAFKTDLFVRVWHYHQGPPYDYWAYTDSTSTFYHIDTIYGTTPVFIKTAVYPDYKKDSSFLPDGPRVSIQRYFVDSFCSDRYFVNYHYFDWQILQGQPPAICWQLVPNVSGYSQIDTTLLQGFGRTYWHWEMGESMPDFWGKDFFSYLKLDDCTWGSKIDVLSLSTSNVPHDSLFSIYPNPAHDDVFIKSGNIAGHAAISLYDITGRLLQQWDSEEQLTRISLKNYTAGTYILFIRNEHTVATYKLQVE